MPKYLSSINNLHDFELHSYTLLHKLRLHVALYTILFGVHKEPFSCDDMLTMSAPIAAVSTFHILFLVSVTTIYYFGGMCEVSANTIALPALAHQRRRKGSEYSIALLPFPDHCSRACPLGYRHIFRPRSLLGGQRPVDELCGHSSTIGCLEQGVCIHTVRKKINLSYINLVHWPLVNRCRIVRV